MAEIQYDYGAIFIDVGQGDATVINQLSNMHSVLIDAGAREPVLSVLKQTNKLEAIFITHWHTDHIRGMPSVIKWITNQHQYRVKVFINRQPSSSKTAERLRRTLDEADKEGSIILPLPYSDKPDKIETINGCFFILWPLHKIGIFHPEKINLDSQILRFEAGAFSIILGGDASGDAWPQVDPTKLKADVLKFPHHGGKLYKKENDWSAYKLISKVKPGYVISSVGKKKQHGHPSEEFIATKSRYPKIQFLDTTKGNINLRIESATGKISIRK
jgi:beta-lactamase superfamily II metal-dependent hydrolase